MYVICMIWKNECMQNTEAYFTYLKFIFMRDNNNN